MTTIKDILRDLVNDIRLIYVDEGTDSTEAVDKREEALEESYERILKIAGE